MSKTLEVVGGQGQQVAKILKTLLKQWVPDE